MSLEEFPQHPLNKTTESEGVTGDMNHSPEEHVQIENIAATEILQIQEYVDRQVNQNLRIQSILANNRNNQKVDELITAGIYEDVGYFNPGDERIGELYLEHADDGIQSNLINVYDENNEVIGLRLFKINPQLDEHQKQIKKTIEAKYDSEYRNSFFNQEQEKEKRYEELVEQGKLVYMGEGGVKEIATLCQNGVKYTDIESVAIFDETLEPLISVEKIYVRVKS